MASSLPQFYTDFRFSGEAYSQFHGSSSCPDISALYNYVGDGYGPFNTSSNEESTFLPQVFGISDICMPEYNKYYQEMGVNNATQYFHGGNQEYYGYSPGIEPLFISPLEGNLGEIEKEGYNLSRAQKWDAIRLKNVKTES